MFEVVLEKVKEYKVAVGIVSVGLLLGGGFFLHGQSQQAPAQPVTALAQEVAQSETSSETVVETSTSSSELADFITVDVKGAVKKAGIYELKAGSRVHDAIQQAGGLLETADSKSINLAQKLTDEAVVYVAAEGEEASPVTGTAGTNGASSTGQDSAGKVNLNKATEADLQTISGIGQKRAQDIIAYRESAGGFKSVDDLKNVSGIGAKTLEKLKDYVTVD